MRGKCALAEAIAILKRDSRRFAKRQITWFRREKDICWISMDKDVDNRRIAEEIYCRINS